MKNQEIELSPPKIKVLKLLAEYRFLTSRQIWEKSGAAFEGLPYAHTRVLVSRLAEAGLIKGMAAEREKGRAGAYQWLLEARGARAIGFTSYHNYYKREPSRLRVTARKLELALEEQLELALGEWELLKPQTYSSGKRLPLKTRQYLLLCQVVTWQEYQQTGQLPPSVEGPHTLIVPYRLNQYLAYLPHKKQAIVLILATPHSSTGFWQKRSDEYRRLAAQTKIPVYGVFPNNRLFSIYQEFLEKLGLRAVAVEQLNTVLNGLAS